MSSSPPMVFQVVLQGPTSANSSAVRQQIQRALANTGLGNVTKGTDQATKATKTFGEAIGLAGRNFVAYSSAVAIVGRLGIAMSRATRDAIKFEREFVKLAQVYNVSSGSLKGLNKEISSLSREFGISANVIAKTSVVLAQSGLNAREVALALKTLSKTTLASTFENIAQTAEGAVAIIAQFGQGAAALEKQLGQVNAVSKAFAVESGDIIESIRRTGGAFKAAGGSFTEFISLFTAVRSTTRESAETIATGFRTIFARLQRPKVIDYFRELNIELEDGQGNFVGAYEAIRRLSEGLDQAGIKVGQIKFAEVVEQLGGIRQVSRVIPLITRFTKAERARQVALAGGKSLDADVAKAQETMAQAIERTRQNFSALIREISETSSFRALLDIALSLSNAFIEIARTLKPLIPLIATLGAIKIGGVLATAAKTGLSAGGAGSRRSFASGGKVLGFNRGGSVPGTGNGDTVPAMLEPGEFVIRKSAVQAFGAGGLADINKYANGGKAIAKIGSLGPLVKKDSKRVLDEKGRNTITASDSLEVAINDIAISAQRVQNLADKGNSDAKKLVTSQGKGAGVRRGPIWEKIAAKILRKKLPSGSPSRPLDSVNTDYKYKPKSQAINSIEIARKRIQDSFGINSGFRTDKALLKRYTSRRGEKKVGKEVSIVRPDWNILDPSSFSRNLTTKGKTARKKRLLKKALGGSISGTDTVPALLTPGEFVINKKSAQAFGYGGLAKINKYAEGGPVGVQKFAGGGDVSPAAFSGGNIVSTLFQLSFVMSALTGIVDGVNKELKPISDALVSFGVAIYASHKALTFLTRFKGITTAGGIGQAKDLGGKIKDKLFGGGGDAIEIAVDSVDDEVKRSSDSNDRHLIRINRTLLGILKETQISNVRSSTDPSAIKGQKERGIGRDSRRRTRRSDTLMRESYNRGTVPLPTPAVPATPVTAGAVALAATMVVLAAAVGLVTAAFTLAASAAQQAKEKAIKLGNQQAAVDAAGLESQAKSARSAALVTAGVGAAIGAIFGPIGALAGGLAGLVAGVLLGETALNFFVTGLYTVAKGMIDLAKSFGVGNLIDFDPIETALADFAAGMLPATKKFENQLNALSAATKIASDEIKESSAKKLDAEQKGFKLTTDSGKDESVVRQTEIIMAEGKKYDKNNKEFIRNLAAIETTRQAGVAEAGPDAGLAQAANRKAAELTDKAKEQRSKEIKGETAARLDNISKVAAQSHAIGQSVRLEKQLNDGKQVSRDKNNIITRASLKDGGQLHTLHKQLMANGLTEQEALIEMTHSLDGAGSAIKRFTEILKKQAGFVGGTFRKLFTGPLEESFKAARKLDDGMDVLEGKTSIAGLGRERGSGAADAIGSLIGVGAVGADQTQAAFKGAVPQGVYANLEAKIRERVIADNPSIDQATQTGMDNIDELVKKGMLNAAEGFFGVDVLAKNNMNVNKRTAEATEALLKAEQAKKDEVDKKAKEAAVISRRNNSIPGVFAEGGTAGAAGAAGAGTLVNFQPKGTDTVPAMLTPGEFVMKTSAVDKYGSGMMKEINAGNYAGGGIIQPEYHQGGSTRRNVGKQKVKAKSKVSGGFTNLHDDIRGELDAWFSVDEIKLTGLYEKISTWDALKKLDKQINQPYTSSEYSHVADRIKDTMGGHEEELKKRIDTHTKLLNPSYGKKKDRDVTPGGHTLGFPEAAQQNVQVGKKDPRRQRVYMPGIGFYDPMTENADGTIDTKAATESVELLPEAQRAEDKAKAVEKKEAPTTPQSQTKKVDLVQHYESLLGQGPRSENIDPSKVDRKNPTLLRNLRSNEIAIARAAGAERGLGGSRIKEYSLSHGPRGVELPYPKLEQVRQGQTVLSNIEREFFAYEGASEEGGRKSGPFSYFKKHYNDILNGIDPLSQRHGKTQESRDKKKDRQSNKKKKKDYLVELAVKKMEELSRAQVLATHYGTAIKYPDLSTSNGQDLNKSPIQEDLVEQAKLVRENALAQKAVLGDYLVDQKIYKDSGQMFEELRKPITDRATEEMSETTAKDLIDNLYSTSESKGSKLSSLLSDLLSYTPVDKESFRLSKITLPEGFNNGGYVNGPQGIDAVPAYLSRGEFVMQKSAVNNIGRDNLTNMNAKNFARGGSVGNSSSSTSSTQNVSIDGGQQLKDAGAAVGTSAESLRKAAESMPKEINMSLGTLPAVQVNINGGEVLAAIMPEVERLLQGGIVDALIGYEATKESGGSYANNKKAEQYGGTV